MFLDEFCQAVELALLEPPATPSSAPTGGIIAPIPNPAPKLLVFADEPPLVLSLKDPVTISLMSRSLLNELYKLS